MRMSEMTDAYVKLDKVSKIYGTKEVKIVAVDEISFEIAKGEFVVIVGPSGAGKTTVLNILGGTGRHGCRSGGIRNHCGGDGGCFHFLRHFLFNI